VIFQLYRPAQSIRMPRRMNRKLLRLVSVSNITKIFSIFIDCYFVLSGFSTNRTKQVKGPAGL